MVLRPNSLITSASYTFQMKELDVNGLFGTSTIKVDVNAAPSSGVLNVVPESVTAIGTTFSFPSNNWIDEDQPLMYMYKYRRGSKDKVPLGRF